MKERKKSKPTKLKVTYKLAEGVSEEECQQRLNAAYDILLSEISKNKDKNESEKSEIIIADIVKNKDKILSNLKQKDIDKYCYIKNRFEEGGILNDLKFQSVFKQFYIMNSAGLSNDWKKHFFKLLSDKQCDLKNILSQLYKIPRLDGAHSVQFSFSTKLLHTINNEKPIYDRMVGIVVNKIVAGLNKAEKIQSCLEIYDFLERLYSILAKSEKIKSVINEFRSKFNVGRQDMSDVKVLDFIIWSLGNIKGKSNKSH